MRPKGPLALVISATLAMACSSPSRNAKPVVVAQLPAAGKTTSTTVVTTNGKASANDALTGSTVDPNLIKEGYRAVRRHGSIRYCQTQTITGTKFANTVCRTAEQIQELKRETEKSKRLLIRSGPANCAGNQCGD